MERNQFPIFVPFPSIGQFRDAVVSSKHLNPGQQPVLHYRGRVKLHGTNGAVVFAKDGTYHCQSREMILEIGKDNAGFASHWTDERVERLWRLGTNRDIQTTPYDQVAIFGEWCGGKISPNVALHEVPRMFDVFAIAYITGEQTSWFYHDLGALFDPEIQVYNTDLFGEYELTIDLADPGASTDQIELLTIAVENECPAGRYFDVSGTGEGIVWTCPEGDAEPLYNFKSKGIKHKIAAKMGSLEPAAMAELSELVDLIMRVGQVESRVEQAVRVLREQGHPMESTKETLLLVNWLTADIEKENLPDIAASSFDKKKVFGGCLSAAKHQFKAILDRF
jgi:hypothetical protein